MTAPSVQFGLQASTGLGFTSAAIVDAHFDACRDTYLELLRSVRIRPGDRVLDAGCGTGRFLAPLAGLAAPGGVVHGIDLTPEHVALAAARAEHAACPVQLRRGDLLDLPYPEGAFDVVWCANTVQYLDDDALTRALAELVRVLRPGGMLAVKELDATVISAWPGDPFLFTDFFRAAAAGPGYARNLLRTPVLGHHLAATGLTEVRQRTVLSEHRAPFSPAERAFYTASCAQLASQAEAVYGDDLPEGWAGYRDPDAPVNPLNHPRAQIREGVSLVTGIRPGG